MKNRIQFLLFFMLTVALLGFWSSVTQARVFNAAEEIRLQPATSTGVFLEADNLVANEFLRLDGSKQVISTPTIDLSSEVNGVLPIANGGTNSSAALANGRQVVSSGGSIVEASALGDGEFYSGSLNATIITGTANQISVSTASGNYVLAVPQDLHSGASPTFLGLTLTGLNSNEIVRTDAIGTLTTTGSGIDLTTDVSGVLPIANGGTNNSTALVNGRHIISSGGSIAEASALGDGEFYSGSLVSTIITGTDNQITFSTASGNYVASLPQDITPSANVEFNKIKVGSGVDEEAAALQIEGTDRGLLFPRLTTGQRDSIATPTGGLVVYNTSTGNLSLYDGSSWSDITSGTPTAGTFAQPCVIYDKKAQGVSCGASVDDSETPRTLNTILDAASCSANIGLSGNQVSLTNTGNGFYVKWVMPMRNLGSCHTYFRDASDPSNYSQGVNCETIANSTVMATGTAYVTPTGAYELTYYVSGGGGANSLGVPLNRAGFDEVCARLEIWEL